MSIEKKSLIQSRAATQKAIIASRPFVASASPTGVAKPLSVYVNTHSTGRVDEERLVKALCDMVNLSPRGIREHLKLNKPIYARTSAYGHFGRAPDNEGGFSWEKTDLAPTITKAVS